MPIKDHLIPKLRRRFSDRGLKVTGNSQPCAIFPAVHPGFGDIEIHDDGDELTLVAGHLTHGHFSNYEDKMTDEQKAESIADEMIGFLDAVFEDRVVFWGSHNGLGGWSRRDVEGHAQSVWPVNGKDVVRARTEYVTEYVWSGPLPSRPKLPFGQRVANFFRGRRS